MSLTDVLLTVLLLMSLLILLTLGAFAFFIFKYRVPFKGVLAMGAAFVYLISPIDFAPEIVFGPLGLVDDIGVVTMALTYAKRAGMAVKARRELSW